MNEEISRKSVWIKAKSTDGQPLVACFLPCKGMNLISYTKGGREIIDQSTKSLFEERYAGLGAMIGPHFHHRNPSSIPLVPNEELFPHIAKVKAQGSNEPFSHGIGRYAPWEIDGCDSSEIRAVLRGKDSWNGVLLKDLEGQDFKMEYVAKMLPQGLSIELSVKSEKESVVGLHTYYVLNNGKGKVITSVQDHYIEKSETKSIPSTWNYLENHMLYYTLDRETDFGFHPFPDPLKGTILLDCETHRIEVQYTCEDQENSFQVWHPHPASFVCIEPLSAKDPRKPKLSESRLKILISIL